MTPVLLYFCFPVCIRQMTFFAHSSNVKSNFHNNITCEMTGCCNNMDDLLISSHSSYTIAIIMHNAPTLAIKVLNKRKRKKSSDSR